MAVRGPATYEDALERISELEEELESLDALLLLRERAVTASVITSRTSRELDAEDVLDR